MVKIRLKRVGMKGAPSYRVVVADIRSPRDGRIIENIGWYNPLTDPSTIEIDAERAKHWLSVGAQPSDAVRSLMVRTGLLARMHPVRDGASKTAASETAASKTAASETAATAGKSTGRAKSKAADK